MLRAVADKIDTLILTAQITERTNTYLMKEQITNKDKLSQARVAISRLVAALANEPDQKKRDELARQIEELNKMLDDLI